ncbi:MAG: hypothetical protein GY896_22770 [Gammaproteobacteria bacterium]|nr:hypothetical protein [Gammaproteobacteria bacterium]
MKKSTLKELADRAILRAGGNSHQAFTALLKRVTNNESLKDLAVRLGVSQIIRNAQNDMRTAASSEQLAEFLESTPTGKPVAAISPEDFKLLEGRFLYPLHKSGTYIGLATEELILESIAEIDRNMEGLASAKGFQDAVLRELKRKRKNKKQRPIDVMSEHEINELYTKHCKQKKVA